MKQINNFLHFSVLVCQRAITITFKFARHLRDIQFQRLSSDIKPDNTVSSQVSSPLQLFQKILVPQFFVPFLFLEILSPPPSFTDTPPKCKKNTSFLLKLSNFCCQDVNMVTQLQEGIHTKIRCVKIFLVTKTNIFSYLNVIIREV